MCGLPVVLHLDVVVAARRNSRTCVGCQTPECGDIKDDDVAIHAHVWVASSPPQQIVGMTIVAIHAHVWVARLVSLRERMLMKY